MAHEKIVEFVKNMKSEKISDGKSNITDFVKEFVDKRIETIKNTQNV